MEYLLFMFLRRKTRRREGHRGDDPPASYEQRTRRARVAASFIAPGSRILDLGCGNGLLRDLLPDGCVWEGYDFTPLAPEIGKLDVDMDEFPSGPFDYVVMLGLLWWVRNPRLVLRKAHRSAPLLIASDERKRIHWRHLIPKSQLKPMLPGTGWSIKECRDCQDKGRTYSTVCLLQQV
jgi:SAM-dependent methyltransferase